MQPTKVIEIADYLPKYTAHDLLDEARRNSIMSVDQKDTAEFFLDLSGMLTEVLERIMADFDYLRDDKASQTAVGLRCLAAITLTVDEHMEITRDC